MLARPCACSASQMMDCESAHPSRCNIERLRCQEAYLRHCQKHQRCGAVGTTPGSPTETLPTEKDDTATTVRETPGHERYRVRFAMVSEKQYQQDRALCMQRHGVQHYVVRSWTPPQPLSRNAMIFIWNGLEHRTSGLN
jgi:hypothetical protein